MEYQEERREREWKREEEEEDNFFVCFLSSLTEKVEDHIRKHSNAIVADYFILSSFFTSLGMLSMNIIFKGEDFLEFLGFTKLNFQK
jgi:hypothetical protein